MEIIIQIFIIGMIIMMIIGSIASYYTKPNCYKPESKELSKFNPGCAAYNCAFKLSCKFYKNYINDN